MRKLRLIFTVWHEQPSSKSTFLHEYDLDWRMQRLLHLRSAPHVSVAPAEEKAGGRRSSEGTIAAEAVRDYLKLDFGKLGEAEATRLLGEINSMLIDIS